MAEEDGRRGRDIGVLERCGWAFRDQRAGEIEEVVAQAIAEVRAAEGGGVKYILHREA